MSSSDIHCLVSSYTFFLTLYKDDVLYSLFFFFQAEDGIRDLTVTGVQTCALPIFLVAGPSSAATCVPRCCVSHSASRASVLCSNRSVAGRPGMSRSRRLRIS